jgi:arginine decarboxylase
MLFPKPKRYFLCAGSSEGYTQLNAFDNALLEAGVGNTNLMKMSSILPPKCELVEPQPLEPGSFIPIAYAYIGSVTPQEVIAAGVAVGVPEDPNLNGVIMEYSARGQAEDIERIVRSMAEEAMKHRGFKIKEILSISTQHRVEGKGAAFAGVVLCE